MKRTLLFSVLGATALIITINSCKKEEPDTESQSAVDNSICESEFSRISTLIADKGIKEEGIKLPGGCPNVYIDYNDSVDGFPITLHIDYQTGCIDDDGKTRKGMINATFSTGWDSLAKKPTITFDFIGYSVNGVNFDCTSMTVTRDAINKTTTKVVDGICSTANWSNKWSTTRTMTIYYMNTPLDPSDDEYDFTGSSNGVNRNGKAYTVNITIPIHKKASCSWIDKGRLDLTPAGMATRTIDYGDGKCNNDATLTINGNVFTFKLD